MFRALAVVTFAIVGTACSTESDSPAGDAGTTTLPDSAVRNIAHDSMAHDMAMSDSPDVHASMPGMDHGASGDAGATRADHAAMGHDARTARDAHAGMAMPHDAAVGHRGAHEDMAPAQHQAGGHAPAEHAPAAGRAPTEHAPAAGEQHAGHAEATPADGVERGRHESREHADTTAAGHAIVAPRHQDMPAAAHDSAAQQHAGIPEHAAHDSTAAGHDPMPGMAQGADAAGPGMQHEMAMFDLGGGWMVIGMAQAFPIGTIALPADDGTPLEERALYLTQPAIMFNVESPLSRVSLRTTLNFEGLTQPDGEITFGGWGEGFIDKRHPHTLLHEAMLSVNVWARDGGGFSLSVGKGFAPYGTDDPMSRPAVKYPTNHHLSQILERFTLNGVYSSPRFSAEVGVFGGNEPTSPYDFSNAESFANSWSTRLAARFGAPAMGVFPWELSGSYGYVVEEHDAEKDVTRLYNVALRHEAMTAAGRSYALLEGSMSDPAHHDGYFSILAEGALTRGVHMPYARVEYATRPEYPREGKPGTDEFFRYDHDDEPIGSTRWLIAVAGYGLEATELPFSARPFVEVQWNQVAADEGGIEPEDLFGRSSFFGLTAGFRLFLGGEPMRMGAYGVLDAATFMHRMQMGELEADHAEH